MSGLSGWKNRPWWNRGLPIPGPSGAGTWAHRTHPRAPRTAQARLPPDHYSSACSRRNRVQLGRIGPYPGCRNLSISADCYNCKIENEVDAASIDPLLLAEYYCRNDLPKSSSATHQDVADWVVRDSASNLSSLCPPPKMSLPEPAGPYRRLHVLARHQPLRFAAVLGQLHQHAEA